MKRKALFAILAAAVMLTACGGRPGAEKDGKDVPAVQETDTQDEAGEPEAEPEEAKAAATPEPKEEEALPTAEPDGVSAQEPEGKTDDALEEEQETEPEDDFVKGIITDTGWESEYLGLRYTMPEGMLMATEEYLNQIMGIGAEALSEDFSELQLKYAQMRTVYEMMSTDATGNTNVVLTVEKLPFGNMKAEQYVQSLRQGLEKVSTISYTILSDDGTAEIAGREYIRLSAQAINEGTSMNQDYYVCVADGRAQCFVVTYLDETAQLAEEILNAFTAY